MAKGIFNPDRASQLRRDAESRTKWRLNNPEKNRVSQQQYRQRSDAKTHEYHIKTTYGITASQYQQMLREQGGVCAVCKRPETFSNNGKLPRLSVDHNHNCCPKRSCGKCVRGLLCRKCNIALGCLDDSPDRMRTLAAYVERLR